MSLLVSLTLVNLLNQNSTGQNPTEAELQDAIKEFNTNGLKVKSDSGDETRILAGTIDFLDFATTVRKINEVLGKDKCFS